MIFKKSKFLCVLVILVLMSSVVYADIIDENVLKIEEETRANAGIPEGAEIQSNTADINKSSERVKVTPIDGKEITETQVENMGKELDGKELFEDRKIDESRSSIQIDNILDIPKVMESTPTGTTNTDPNNALFINSTYYGVPLADTADANDRWYFFENIGTNKLCSILNQDGEGDYNIYLYKLDDTTLNLVDYSANVGGFEKINYIGDDGYYFLCISPYEAATTSYNYTFLVDVIENYDQNEVNDNYNEAISYTNTIKTTGTIDNAYDEDWFKLTVDSGHAGNYCISVKTELDKQYALFLYDSNLSSLGNYLIDSNIKGFNLSEGDYYFRILSYTGEFTNNEYNFNVCNYLGGAVFAAPTGNVIQCNGSQVSIDGKNVEVAGTYYQYDWDYDQTAYKHVKESLHIFNNSLSLVGSVYQYEYWKEDIPNASHNIAVVYINDGFYHAFYSNATYGYNSYYFTTDPTPVMPEISITVPNIPVYIDLDTAKVVDNYYSLYYTYPFLAFDRGELIEIK